MAREVTFGRWRSSGHGIHWDGLRWDGLRWDGLCCGEVDRRWELRKGRGSGRLSHTTTEAQISDRHFVDVVVCELLGKAFERGVYEEHVSP